MKKILFITTISGTINAFLVPHIKDLIDKGYTVDCAANLTEDIDESLINEGVEFYNIPFSRNPLNINNIKAFYKLIKLQKLNKYDVVHTHTPVASMYARLLKLKFKKIKIMYTAHGFHFFKGAPAINWIIYYPIEKICAYFTDALITINKEDYEFANSKIKAKKIYYTHGIGIDTNKFNNITVNIEEKRKQLGVATDDVVLLSVGELNKNKNHEIIIRTLATLKDNKTHYFIVGKGNLHKYLEELSKELKVEDRVHLLGYRKDIGELCNAADIFCFPSYREGLSVALMEAMAVGLPIVCSNIRGNSDLVKPNRNGFLFEKDDIDSIKRSIELLNDDEILNNIKDNNKNDIKLFDLNNVIKEMENIYKEELDA